MAYLIYGRNMGAYVKKNIIIIITSLFLILSVSLNAKFLFKINSNNKKFDELKKSTELCQMITLKNSGGDLMVRCKSFGGRGVLIHDKNDETKGWCLAIDKTGTLNPVRDEIHILDKKSEEK